MICLTNCKRMRVFVISRGVPTENDPLNGIFEFDQAKALSSEHIDVVMLVIDFRSRIYKRKYGYFHYIKDQVKVFELSLPLGVYRRALPILQLLLLFVYNQAVKKIGKPDIIHSHFYSIAAISSCLKKKRIPFVITEHSSKLNRNINEISKLDQRLARKAYQGATVIAVSDLLKRSLDKNFKTNAIVIDNIIDNECFQNHQRENKNEFRFISVGNLIPRKGFDILIKSFKKAFDNEKDVYLDIIGEGDERANLERIIISEGLSHRIRLLGQMNRIEIGRVMINSNAFVLASLRETFGVSYVEAMMTGLPVIATRCGGPETFVDETNGILINPNETETLTDALKYMYDKAKNYDSALISRTAQERFSPNNIANQLIKNYKNILQQ